MSTILVTGGCGFIGSHFVRLLANDEAGYRIVNLDNLTYAGNLENLADVEGGDYRFVRGDIGDRALVERVLHEERPFAVVNFAAESHVDRSIIDSSTFVRTNFNGVHVLLEAIRSQAVERFLQISTDEVYGDRDGKEAAAEDAPLTPGSPYAASKAAADLLCLAYRRTYALPVLIARSSNNYGPYQFPEKLLPLMTRNALAGMKLPLYGDGAQVRDWLYVEDNCRAILTVLHSGAPGSIYNIGTGRERTNLAVVRSLCAVLAEQSGIDAETFTANIESVADRPGHDRRYALDTTRIQRDLGWTATTAFSAGLRRTVQWYKEHPEWLARVTSGEYKSYYDSVYRPRWENAR